MTLKTALLVLTVSATGLAGCAYDGYGHRHGRFGRHDAGHHDRRDHHDRGDHHDRHDHGGRR